VASSLHAITSDDEPVQEQTHGMTTPPTPHLYKRHHFPTEIISHWEA
jgi:hypothetical protein